MHEDYSLTCPPLSIARYSFKQLSRLRRREENEKCPNFETVTKGIRTRALSIASPQSYRASLYCVETVLLCIDRQRFVNFIYTICLCFQMRHNNKLLVRTSMRRTVVDIILPYETNIIYDFIKQCFIEINTASKLATRHGLSRGCVKYGLPDHFKPF